MINEIPVRVSFKNNTLTKKSTVVVEGDYNTTKLVFEFEEDVTNRQLKFGMTNPAGELVMYCGLINNEVTLSSEDIDGKVSSVFATDGLYTFRVFLLGDDGKSQLTSAPGYLPVDQSQVQTGMKAYGPFIDNLMKQVDNLDIELVEVEGKSAVKITHKDGSTELCNIVPEVNIPEASSQIEAGNPDPVNSDAVIGYTERIGVPKKTSYVWDISMLKDLMFHDKKLCEMSVFPSQWRYEGDDGTQKIGYVINLHIGLLLAARFQNGDEIHHLIESPIPQDAFVSKYSYVDVDPNKFSLENKNYFLGNPQSGVLDEDGELFYDSIDGFFSEIVDGEVVKAYNSRIALDGFSDLTKECSGGCTLDLRFYLFVAEGNDELVLVFCEELQSFPEYLSKLKVSEEITPVETTIECGVIGG